MIFHSYVSLPAGSIFPTILPNCLVSPPKELVHQVRHLTFPASLGMPYTIPQSSPSLIIFIRGRPPSYKLVYTPSNYSYNYHKPKWNCSNLAPHSYVDHSQMAGLWQCDYRSHIFSRWITCLWAAFHGHSYMWVCRGVQVVMPSSALPIAELVELSDVLLLGWLNPLIRLDAKSLQRQTQEVLQIHTSLCWKNTTLQTLQWKKQKWTSQIKGITVP